MVHLSHMDSVSISHTVKDYPQKLPYEKIKNDILGKRYQLSLTFIGPDRARTLNQNHRGKDYVPNVLSFPLDDTMGEIYIAPAVAKKEAKNFDLTPTGYMGFLFIHGCLHLKGYDHGDTMDKAEKRYLKRYALT